MLSGPASERHNLIEASDSSCDWALAKANRRSAPPTYWKVDPEEKHFRRSIKHTSRQALSLKLFDFVSVSKTSRASQLVYRIDSHREGEEAFAHDRAADR